MPTPEQLESRAKLEEFVKSVAKPIQNLTRKIKSEWFGRPDDELKGWIERGNAIKEIEDTRGYRLIMSQADREIAWAQEQLEIGTEDDNLMRGYLKALRAVKGFVLTTNRNADIASTVLAERVGAIGRDSFVKNARVEG